MTSLKIVDRNVLLDKVKELGIDAKIDDLPLALYAGDSSTLMALQEAGVDINPKRAQRGGRPSVIELAVRRYDADSVRCCLDANEPFGIEDADVVEAVKAAVGKCVDYNRKPLFSEGFDFFVRKACVGAWGLSLDVMYEITKAMQLFDFRPRSRYHELISIISGLLRIRFLIQQDSDYDSTNLRKCALQGFRSRVSLLIEDASKEERLQVLFSGAIHGDAWVMKSALDCALKKGDDLSLSEDQITHLADVISRSPSDVCLVATSPSYKLGKNTIFLWHLLLHIIKRDRADCLQAILSASHVAANASIFGAPLLVISVNCMARKCFMCLLSNGAIPFYYYPSQYCKGIGFMSTNITYGPSHPLSKVIAEDEDIRFFAGCHEGSAIDINNKESQKFL